MITFHIISIFPDMFSSYFNESILKRAIEDKKIAVKLYNPRDYAKGKHKNVDNTPYGGGPGMVMMAEPILEAWKVAKGRKRKAKTTLFSPGGEKLTNTLAREYVEQTTDIILICGRYEGIDARVKMITEAEEVSLGDYVITGGELAAMVAIDVMSRQIKGVLGNYDSLEDDRISSSEMYTRPETFTWKGKKYSTPKVLLSGDHKKIEEWKQKRV